MEHKKIDREKINKLIAKKNKAVDEGKHIKK